MGIVNKVKSLLSTTPASAAEPSPVALTQSQTTQAVKKKVLIVEDDQYIRDLYIELLRTNGYEVFTAHNGEQGLQAVQEYKPDLVMLDLIMPVMDGKTMLHKLRQIPEYYGLPVIILTNSGDADSMTQTQLYDNAKGFLIKANTTPDQVLKHIKDLLYPPEEE